MTIGPASVSGVTKCTVAPEIFTPAEISAGKSAARAASISAAMFDPWPEIRMATRRLIACPLRPEVEVIVVDDPLLAVGFDHPSKQRNRFTAARQHIHDTHRGIR